MIRLITLSLLSVAVINAYCQQITIRNVNVIDVKNGKVLTNQSVVLRNEKITWVGPDSKLKAGSSTRTIDGTGKFLMPGLIDSHIHFFQSGGLYTRPDAIDFRERFSYEKEIQFGLDNVHDYLKRYLRLGITTVIDVGGPFSNFMIRDSIGKQNISPNILVTGPLFSIVDRPQLGKADPPIIKVTNNTQVDSLFRKMLPYKPDFIKIWYIAGNQYPAEKSFPLVKYIAEQSAKNNLKLAVHATELKTARLAVDAGANILVHSIDDEIIPDDFVKILKDKKVTYIPTLIVGSNYYKTFSGRLAHHSQDLMWANPFAYKTLSDMEEMKESELPPGIQRLRKRSDIPKVLQRDDSIMNANLRKLMSAGVNIATGTDAGNIGTLHASSYIQEAEAMHRAGLTPADVIRCSTINPATGFGLEKIVGTVEANKTADLILLAKNPLESIENLNAIELIIKNGRTLNADSLIAETPEQIIQRQVNAYNARDIDAFISTYSPDIQILDYNGKIMMKGHDEMRKSYKGFFDSTENLHCEIESRIVINNKVIDKEKVRAGDHTIHAVAVYEVEDGKIKKVMFIN